MIEVNHITLTLHARASCLRPAGRVHSSLFAPAMSGYLIPTLFDFRTFWLGLFVQDGVVERSRYFRDSASALRLVFAKNPCAVETSYLKELL